MMEPIVRQMILCEDARLRKGSRGKFDIFGIMNVVHAPAEAFPMRLSFSVFLFMTNARGRGSGRVVVVDEDTEEEIYAGELRTYDLGADPMALISITVPVPLCILPTPGLYRATFVYNETVVGTCDLLARETP